MLARHRADGDLGGLAEGDPRKQVLGDVGLDVHRVEVGDGEELGCRRSARRDRRAGR